MPCNYTNELYVFCILFRYKSYTPNVVTAFANVLFWIEHLG